MRWSASSGGYLWWTLLLDIGCDLDKGRRPDRRLLGQPCDELLVDVMFHVQVVGVRPNPMHHQDCPPALCLRCLHHRLQLLEASSIGMDASDIKEIKGIRRDGYLLSQRATRGHEPIS